MSFGKRPKGTKGPKRIKVRLGGRYKLPDGSTVIGVKNHKDHEPCDFCAFVAADQDCKRFKCKGRKSLQFVKPDVERREGGMICGEIMDAKNRWTGEG